MQSYARRVIDVCHRRGAHAMGGMSAFIPVKGDDAANQSALDKVRADKLREVTAGHDGTWVAHPDLVPVAMDVFDQYMPGPNQLELEQKENRLISARDLIEPPAGEITNAGVEDNIDVALRYITAWLGGRGAVPIRHLMEDAATAEIARAQLWQWRTFEVSTKEGMPLTEGILQAKIAQAGQTLGAEFENNPELSSRVRDSVKILGDLVMADEFVEFLTLPAYQVLVGELKTPMRLMEFED